MTEGPGFRYVPGLGQEYSKIDVQKPVYKEKDQDPVIDDHIGDNVAELEEKVVTVRPVRQPGERYSKVVEFGASSERGPRVSKSHVFGEVEIQNIDVLRRQRQELISSSIDSEDVFNADIERIDEEILAIYHGLFQQMDRVGSSRDGVPQLVNFLHDYSLSSAGSRFVESEMQKDGIDVKFALSYIVSRLYAGLDIPVFLKIRLQNLAFDILRNDFDLFHSRDADGNRFLGNDWFNAFDKYQDDHKNFYFDQVTAIVQSSVAQPRDYKFLDALARYNIAHVERQRNIIEQEGEKYKKDYLLTTTEAYNKGLFPLPPAEVARRLDRVRFRPQDLLFDDETSAGLFDSQTDTIMLDAQFTGDRHVFFHEFNHAVSGRTKIASDNNEVVLVTGLNMNKSPRGLMSDKIFSLYALNEAVTEEYAATLCGDEPRSYQNFIVFKKLLIDKFPGVADLLPKAYFSDYGVTPEDLTGGLRELSGLLTTALADKEVRKSLIELKKPYFL